MAKYLLTTHGRMCEGLLDTLEFVFPTGGKVSAIPFFVDGIDAEYEIEKYFESLPGDEKAVIFTDITWGSVNQKMLKYTERPNTFLISGVNLPFLLDIIPLDDDICLYTLQEHVDECKDSLVFVNNIEIQSQKGDE